MKPEDRRSPPDRARVDNEQGASQGRKPGSFGRWLWDWTKSILIAIILFLVIRTFLVEAFRIPTGSMERTLLVGDFLLVNKAVYGAQLPGTDLHLPAFDQPQRGDVVVFVPPHEPDKNYVKRLIGATGDTLAMREGILYLNGEAQAEPYARHTDPPEYDAPLPYNWQRRYLVAGMDPEQYRPTRDNWGPIVVPEGKYFMLGDNRDDSEDSRYWGFVDEGAIKGQPLFIYYSFDPSMAHPFPWLTQIRWGRIGSTIH